MKTGIYFDSDYYLSRNPDVAAAGVDPYWHYMVQGWREGRNPSAFFNTQYYLLQNRDVAEAAVNPLEHFEQQGWHEGRSPSVFFDTRYYLSQNPDVAAAGVNPLEHFLQQGWREGRNPSEFFDTRYYLSQNPDVAAAGIDPFEHWLNQGVIEERSPNANFNLPHTAQEDTELKSEIIAQNRPGALEIIGAYLRGERPQEDEEPQKPAQPRSTPPQAPVLSQMDNATFLENTVNAAPQLIDADVTLTDTDSLHFNNGSLVINYTSGGGAEDSLSIRNQGTGAGQIGFDGTTITYEGTIIGSVTGGQNGASGQPLALRLNGNASVQIVEKLIENLTYANSSNTPAASRTIGITLHDGRISSAITSVILAVTPESDNIAPVIGGLDNATFLENTVNASAQLIDSNVTVSDADNTHFNGGNVTVTYSAGGSAEDSLSIRNQGAGAGQIGFDGTTITYEGTVIGTISGGNNGAAGNSLVISLNASATTAAVEALLENLTYENSSNTPTASRTLSITVNDGTDSSNPLTSSITVTPQDEPITFVLTNIGSDSFVGGNADDRFIVNDPNDILQIDTLMGGVGTDTVEFTTGGLYVAFISTLSSIERLVLNGVGNYEVEFHGLVDFSIFGSAQSDSFNFYGDGTYDTYFTGVLAPLLSGNHTIDGGAGSDSIYWWPDAVNSFSDSMLQNKTSIETVKMDPGAGFTVNLSTYASALALSNAGNTLTVDVQYNGAYTLSADAQGGATFKLTDSWDHLVTATLANGVNNSITIADGNTSNITGGDGDDTVTGGDLADTLSGGAGNNELHGQGGNDQLTVGADASQYYGDGGDDRFLIALGTKIWAAADLIDGGIGSDIVSLSGGGSIDFSVGAAFNGVETVRMATTGQNVIFGGGDYTVEMLQNNQTVAGGSGNEVFSTNDQRITSQVITGGNGSDVLLIQDSSPAWGMDITDALIGSMGLSGIETIRFTPTSNEPRVTAQTNFENAISSLLLDSDGFRTLTIDMGAIIESMFGGGVFADNNNRIVIENAQYIYLSWGMDNRVYVKDATRVTDSDGNNEVHFIGGDGYYEGGPPIGSPGGNDTIYGGMGNDTINDGPGDGYLSGGAGNDLLTGGPGNELFYFGNGTNQDVITDFDAPGAGVGDLIHLLSNLNGSGIVDWATLQTHISQVGGNTVIDLTGGNTITLTGVTATDLTTDDFVFV